LLYAAGGKRDRDGGCNVGRRKGFAALGHHLGVKLDDIACVRETFLDRFALRVRASKRGDMNRITAFGLRFEDDRIGPFQRHVVQITFRALRPPACYGPALLPTRAPE